MPRLSPPRSCRRAFPCLSSFIALRKRTVTIRSIYPACAQHSASLPLESTISRLSLGLREGMAWAFVRYSLDYVAYETVARTAGLGVHGHDACQRGSGAQSNGQRHQAL